MTKQKSAGKVKISLRQAFDMLRPYVWSKILDQIKSVALIVVYLVLFQTLILGIPVSSALIVSFGIGVVIVGLAFFMEGLFLGLMPLGETCGVKLPQKTVLPVILLFSFILGVGATYAEPAIGVLKTAGSSVKAWDAPLLFLILNKYSGYLVVSVGIGVGIAVLFGMLRFIYNWSLKPFIYVLYVVIIGVSIWAYFEPNLVFVTGLAWDCGGVTTGPVTVPLVLALGIGISRVVSKGDGGAGGFGVVTLASAFPIISVLALGLMFMNAVPKPMNDIDMFSAQNRQKAAMLFSGDDDMRGYCIQNASYEAQLALFDGNKDQLNQFIGTLANDPAKQSALFGSSYKFTDWTLRKASDELRLAVYGSPENIKAAAAKHQSGSESTFSLKEIFSRNSLAAAQAILPLSFFLIVVLIGVLREKIKRIDEIFLGIVLAVVGMSLFNVGIELGLSRLGNDVGSSLPSSFKSIAMVEQTREIGNFDPSVVNKAVSSDGAVGEFFYEKSGDSYRAIPYDKKSYDTATAKYSYTPFKGPLFGFAGGIAIAIFFAFMLGYSATLAEPALNALGVTVEEITVGTFKKKMLMQAVAIGVGIGIAFGIAKIIFNLPLIWMLVPPYFVLAILTAFSNEEFVNIGWDSAGVTTGPVTVPLVLAMGLGVGLQVGVVEGFGILALASVWPILSVLLVGLYVTMKRKSALSAKAE